MLEERIKRATRSKPVKLEPAPSPMSMTVKKTRPSTAPSQAPTTNGHLQEPAPHVRYPLSADVIKVVPNIIHLCDFKKCSLNSLGKF